MKTVYDFFLEHYKFIQTDDSICFEVKTGIAYYLKTLQIYDTWENAETIANMELARFKLMDKNTFEMFFEKYEVRHKIEALVQESKILAVNRIVSGESIDRESYQYKLDKFYDLISCFLNNRKYASWIESVTEEIIYCLKYASGEIDYIVEDFLEWEYKNCCA